MKVNEGSLREEFGRELCVFRFPVCLQACLSIEAKVKEVNFCTTKCTNVQTHTHTYTHLMLQCGVILFLDEETAEGRRRAPTGA